MKKIVHSRCESVGWLFIDVSQRIEVSMLKAKVLVVLATVLMPVLLMVSCKDSAKEAARLQAQRDSVARAEAAKRAADSLAQVEAAEAARAAAEAEALEAAKQPNPSLRFHVIVGGFVIQSNADNYLAQMRAQYSAARLFVAPNGFKLVSVGDFATYADALQMMRGVGREDLWVYEEGGPYDTSSWLENRDSETGASGDDVYSMRKKKGSNEPVDEFDM